MKRLFFCKNVIEINMMDRAELEEKLKAHDPERVKSYLEILDRMFLNVLVAKLLDKDDVSFVIDQWKDYIKTQINFDSGARNDFLMGTPLGRLVSYGSGENVEDGETLRLSFLSCMDLATDIAKHNYLGEEN